jgi:hypothetical protein
VDRNEVTIRSASGGYIVTECRYLSSEEHIFPSLEAVFEFLLMKYERRSEVFKGDSYGKVDVIRKTD